MAEAARAAADAPVIIWEPQPGPQTALLACPIFEVFFGGARGGGKTDGMLGDFASHAAAHGENAAGLMVRRQRTELLDTIERSRAVYSAIGAKYNEQDKLWRFPDGARLRFAYLERDADADGYQGHSYTRVYIEEIGTFPSPKPVMKLMATLRSGHGVPVGFRATGNPGGPGHQWVKARYIDPAPLGWKILTEVFKNPWTGESLPRERVFIPSKLQDNRYLGADYVANLQLSGSEQLVRAWLEGDWSIVEGAYFDCWRADRHVVRPFAVPEHWPRFRAFDWGSARPFSVGWWAVASEDHVVPEGRIPKGAMVCYREWYGAKEPNVGLKLTAEEVAKGIVSRTAEAIDYDVADPSIHKEDGGPSIAERMYEASGRTIRWRPADNRRVPEHGHAGGWDQMRARLIGEDDRPMIYWFSTCADSIRTIPALQHSETRPEDVDTDGEDHAADQARYAAMSRPYIRPKQDETPKPLPTLQDLTLNKLWQAQPKPNGRI